MDFGIDDILNGTIKGVSKEEYLETIAKMYEKEKIKEEVITINNLLRQFRESKGMTQIQVAKATGLSKQMVSKMESPEGNPTLTTLVKYCTCVGIDLAEAISETYGITEGE